MEAPLSTWSHDIATLRAKVEHLSADLIRLDNNCDGSEVRSRRYRGLFPPPPLLQLFHLCSWRLLSLKRSSSRTDSIALFSRALFPRSSLSPLPYRLWRARIQQQINGSGIWSSQPHSEDGSDPQRLYWCLGTHFGPHWTAVPCVPPGSTRGVESPEEVSASGHLTHKRTEKTNKEMLKQRRLTLHIDSYYSVHIQAPSHFLFLYNIFPSFTCARLFEPSFEMMSNWTLTVTTGLKP